ncbi:MAG: RDD family protein [Gammaproteobacteria bacterium]
MSTPHIPEPISDSLALTSPGVLRRLAAGFYDVLIVLALCMVATLLIVPFAPGHTLEAFYAHHTGVKLMYQMGLLALGYAFFAGFWTHGGQTLGMRTWSLQLVRMDGTHLGWYRALIRYLTLLIPWLLLLLGCEFLINAGRQPHRSVYTLAAIGIFMLVIATFVWPAFDPHHLAWNDRLSGTRMVLLRRSRKPRQT